MIKESNLEKGISAIIPTYKGEAFISKLLDSLINQTINPNLFEAIFIVNGELDSTPDIIKKYREENPQINIILTYSDPGVSNARNHGIELINKEYTIFIDDDDYISYNYFEKMYEYAKKDRIVIGTFYDVDQNSGEVKDSYLTPKLEKSGLFKNPYDNLREMLTITTDKLVPTDIVKKYSFNPDLKNGVDIAYYIQLYADYDFEFYIIDKNQGANYYRLLRDNSISRMPLSYDFNVTDRLKVINEINKNLKRAKKIEVTSFLKTLTGGQVFKINQYLEKHPEDYKKVLEDINSYNFDFFPFKYLNEDISKLDNPKRELIISYAFSPTNTATSNTVAKRILTEKKNVDVICGSLDELDKDFTLENIVNQFLINKIVIESNFSTGWENIKNFVKKSMATLDNAEVYDKIYSRANFVHSHFLAIEYKLAHPETYWRAEFSDPLIYAFGKDKLSVAIEDEDYIGRINEKLNLNLSVNDDINCICEYLTFLLCDEVIFTNKNQKEVMISTNPYDVKDIVNKKAKISSHPTLDMKYYYAFKSSYNIDNNYLNLAYFGDIYSNRHFEDFINAFDSLNENIRNKIRLHIFTSSITLFQQVLSSKIYEKTILNPSVDFLEFLNLTTKFDVLLVEDSQKGNFKINPYLPSKISDYKGSGSSIWGVCESESVMDNLDIDYKSKLNNIDSGKTAIENIVKDKLNIENNVLNNDINPEEYYHQRLIQLTQKISELIDVCQEEFRKDSEYENKISELENINSQILNSNSWKATEKLRKIKRKFK